MRIAVVTTSYPSDRDDPSGHFVYSEAQALIEAGHEVVVFAPSVDGRMTGDGPRVVELPHWGLFGWPGALARLRTQPWALLGLLPFATRARQSLARTGPFERVIAHWLVPCFWPIFRDYVGSTHVVCHGSDVRLVEALPRALQRRVISSLCHPNVSVRCVSNELAERLRALMLAHGRGAFHPIAVEPAAVEIPVLAPRAELRRRLGLAATPLIVIVGRVVASKRIDVALDVIKAASATADPQLQPRVIVIGDGSERAHLQRHHPEATWLGRLGRSDTLRYLGAADLLVTASLQEGASTVVREARAVGTHVVAAPAGDLLARAREDRGLFVATPFEAPPHPHAGTAIQLVRSCLDSVVIDPTRRFIPFPADSENRAP